ncbi:MAG: hypothetical protein RLZZ628_662 [Bacteroidota bacterium]|jgi:hypothetical protein
MYSIFHFFKFLADNKVSFQKAGKLEDFPYDETMFSCKNAGQFPDMAIKLNISDSIFTGGELLELKDSDSYTISSFNSTIPTGKKAIAQVIKGENSLIKQQMEQAGDNIQNLPVRDVFYLIRGKKKDKTKICLVHGSFFETLQVQDLISQSFAQVLEERLTQSGQILTDEMKQLLVSLFSEQANFSKVRNIDKSSVKLRFRIMTEVKAEGNLLNNKKYPDIQDNTLNLIVPCHQDDDEKLAKQKMLIVSNSLPCKIFKLKHILNGYFLVFQCLI